MAGKHTTFVQRQIVGKLIRQYERTPQHTDMAEERFKRHAAGIGAKLFRPGWPDFWCEHEGRAFAVEVKHGQRDALRPSQVTMFAALERAGITVYVWSPANPRRLRRWSDWPRESARK